MFGLYALLAHGVKYYKISDEQNFLILSDITNNNIEVNIINILFKSDF